MCVCEWILFLDFPDFPWHSGYSKQLPRKRIMEAKRADSQGFGIDQLNTLQTFEEWSSVFASYSGIMWDRTFSGAWDTAFALETWKKGGKRQHEQQTQQRRVFRSVWTDYLGLESSFRTQETHALKMFEKSLNHWTPETARPMHPMFLGRVLEPSQALA